MTLLFELQHISVSEPDTAISDNHETDPIEKGRDPTLWQLDNTEKATKSFDYTTISDRLRIVSWSNDSYPTGVVKPVYGIPTFPPKQIKTKRNISLNVSIMICQFQL